MCVRWKRNPSVIATRCHLPLGKGGYPPGCLLSLIRQPAADTFPQGKAFSERRGRRSLRWMRRVLLKNSVGRGLGPAVYNYIKGFIKTS